MSNGLQVRRAGDGPLSRQEPPRRRLLEQSSLGIVVCEHFRLILNATREAVQQDFGDARMDCLTPATQQRFVCRILDQRMLEHAARFRAHAASKDDLRMGQEIEGVFKAAKVDLRQAQRFGRAEDNTFEVILAGLDKKVREMIKDAESRALGNKRKTLRPYDL